MDANGLQFWMLSQAKDWNLSATPSLAFSSATNRLRLLSVSSVARQPEGQAAAFVDRVPMTLDQFDSYARWDANSGHVVAGGGGPGEVPIYAAPAGQAVTDLALGYDDVLYLAAGGSLVLIDRRNRWPMATLAVPGFTFWRLAPLAEGGMMALDRQARQLGRVTGLPLQTGPIGTPDPGILRSCQQNPDPPQIAARYALPAASLATNQPIAICPMDTDAFAILWWNTAAASSFVQTFSPSQGFGPAVQLAGAAQPYAIAWIGNQQIAVLVTSCSEALVYDLSSPGVAVSSSDSYVIVGQNLGPFAHTLDLPPRYPNPLWFETPPPPWQSATAYAVGQSVLDRNGATQTVAEAGTSGFSEPAWSTVPGGTTSEGSIAWINAGSIAPLLPLVPLSLNSFDAAGTTDPANPQTFDSGSTRTVWHRLFLEAIVPPSCGIIVWLAAADALDDLTLPATSWYPHLVGSPDTSAIPAATACRRPCSRLAIRGVRSAVRNAGAGRRRRSESARPLHGAGSARRNGGTHLARAVPWGSRGAQRRFAQYARGRRFARVRLSFLLCRTLSPGDLSRRQVWPRRRCARTEHAAGFLRAIRRPLRGTVHANRRFRRKCLPAHARGIHARQRARLAGRLGRNRTEWLSPRPPARALGSASRSLPRARNGRRHHARARRRDERLVHERSDHRSRRLSNAPHLCDDLRSRPFDKRESAAARLLGEQQLVRRRHAVSGQPGNAGPDSSLVRHESRSSGSATGDPSAFTISSQIG